MFSGRSLTIFSVCVVGGIAVSAYSWAQVKNIPVTADDKPTIHSEDTQVMMQAKLAHSQKVFEGLVTQDFKSIEKAAVALSKISLTPPPDLRKAGDKSDEQVYEHFRMEFARLAGQLEGHARRKELEATAYVQQNLTATCIACHDYIRDEPSGH